MAGFWNRPISGRIVVVLFCVLGGPGFLGAAEPTEILDAFQREYMGTVYRFGACSRRQMDCSCLVQRLFRTQFELDLPRDTRAQVRSMRYLRVKSIRRPKHLTPGNLCIGDLIYTYRGSNWLTGFRHVVVYAGKGRVLHSSSSLGGVGLSPLSWVRQFTLQGVYRPLGC